MPSVLVTGWKPGLKKVSMTKVLKARAAIGLEQAKSLTEQILRGESVRIDGLDATEASQLAAELENLGATALVQENQVREETNP